LKLTAEKSEENGSAQMNLLASVLAGCGFTVQIEILPLVANDSPMYFGSSAKVQE
jgi:hypothetical protein